VSSATVTYSELAISDLKIIADYLIVEAGVDVALKVTDEIHRIINTTISDNPKAGSSVLFIPETPMRYFTVGKYPYNIYYELNSNIVLIVRVLHGRRNIRKLLNTI